MKSISVLTECEPGPGFDGLYRGFRGGGSPSSQAWVSHQDPSAGSSTHFTMLITAVDTPHPVWRPVAHRNQHLALLARLPLHHHGNRSLLTTPHRYFFSIATFPEGWFQAWQLAIQLLLKHFKVKLWHSAMSFFPSKKKKTREGRWK